MSASKLRVLVSRHSAFYTPLILTVTPSFLGKENLTATYGVLPKGRGAHDLIRQGEADVVQAAVSSNWKPMEKGERDLALHFAQINQRDGFFLAGRRADPSFHWKKLEGKSLLADHGGQPLVMLKYAAHREGVNWNKISVIDAGSVEEIDAAFRSGRGDYVHQQGPAPQQLEQEGVAHVLASVGASIPPVAFSSLMASREFLAGENAKRFLNAFRKARSWASEAAPGEIAEREASFFLNIDRSALSAAIARYQSLGCWKGELEITRELYEQALEVFLHSGAITRRYPYDEVVARTGWLADAGSA